MDNTPQQLSSDGWDVGSWIFGEGTPLARLCWCSISPFWIKFCVLHFHIDSRFCLVKISHTKNSALLAVFQPKVLKTLAAVMIWPLSYWGESGGGGVLMRGRGSPSGRSWPPEPEIFCGCFPSMLELFFSWKPCRYCGSCFSLWDIQIQRRESLFCILAFQILNLLPFFLQIVQGAVLMKRGFFSRSPSQISPSTINTAELFPRKS